MKGLNTLSTKLHPKTAQSVKHLCLHVQHKAKKKGGQSVYIVLSLERERREREGNKEKDTKKEKKRRGNDIQTIHGI